MSEGLATATVPAAVAAWAAETAGMTPEALLRWAWQTWGDGLIMASSLGAEDQVLLHMLAAADLPIPVFTLDTGRLFPETYELLERSEARYGRRIQVYFPEAAVVEAMVAAEGPNLFRRSVELRRRCCGVRKVAPLRRALAGKAAWITGLRRGQGTTRDDVVHLSWDAAHAMVKLCPLWDWDQERTTAYLHTHDVPYNPLHDQGFASIGCACCTRAVAPGEDPRAGRWWWEQPEHKECGLHLVDGKLVRRQS